MSISINCVIQSGFVKWPALRYGADGKPEFRFVFYRETQSAEGQTFSLSIPCCAVSGTGERLASKLDEGDFVVVTQGELVYRKRQTKVGEQSRLEVLAWRVQKDDAALATSVATEPSADHARDELTTEAPPKVRKSRYPKWRPPAPAHSKN